jgi:hypothetical protein
MYLKKKYQGSDVNGIRRRTERGEEQKEYVN